MDQSALGPPPSQKQRVDNNDEEEEQFSYLHVSRRGAVLVVATAIVMMGFMATTWPHASKGGWASHTLLVVTVSTGAS